MYGRQTTTWQFDGSSTGVALRERVCLDVRACVMCVRLCVRACGDVQVRDVCGFVLILVCAYLRARECVMREVLSLSVSVGGCGCGWVCVGRDGDHRHVRGGVSKRKCKSSRSCRSCAAVTTTNRCSFAFGDRRVDTPQASSTDGAGASWQHAMANGKQRPRQHCSRHR
jgi:hypothetical protein